MAKENRRNGQRTQKMGNKKIKKASENKKDGNIYQEKQELKRRKIEKRKWKKYEEKQFLILFFLIFFPREMY